MYFYDDKLVYLHNFESLMSTLEATLERMRSHSLRLNQVKYTFALLSVEFLGHKINGAGVQNRINM